MPLPDISGQTYPMKEKLEEGIIANINVEKQKFSLCMKNGQYTFCTGLEIKELQRGDAIHFHNEFGCYYFFNSRTHERIAAHIEEIGQNGSHFESFCKY
jgi:hypothetical protein